MDDDPVSQRILTAVLARPGWVVECVRDGWEALTRFDTDVAGIDLLVTDHAMPGLDGVALMEQLRDRGYRGPAIVVSAGVAPPDVVRYRELGVEFVLLKPIDAARIRVAVEVALGAVAPAHDGGPEAA